MTYLVDVPVAGGGRLLVQADAADLPSGLELAAPGPGEIAARAGHTLQEAIDELGPALRAIRDRLTAMAPDEVSVEFGILLGAETNVVVAKGKADVHFTVTMTWREPPAAEGAAATRQDTAAGSTGG